METNAVGLPQGWTKILRNSRANIALLYLCGASVLTSESSIHFIHVQNFRCVLNYNDNAN